MKIIAACAIFLSALFFVRAEDTPSTRAAFLKLIDRPRVEPAPEIGEPKEDGEFKIVHFTYLSEANERVPGIALHLTAPPSPRLPCVIVMHGTGGKKENELGLLKQIATRGGLGIAIDARYHGERAGGLPGTDAYNAAILKRFKGEAKNFPQYWDTVWDAMRLIDILSAREDVDASRIGVMGISKGGIEAYFLAAADARVAVVVPCIGVQSFKWGIENDGWHGRVGTIKKSFDAAAHASGVFAPNAEFVRTFFDKVAPGIYGAFDGPQMLPLIAPRPLLMINGDGDANTPLPGVMLAAEAAKAVYEKTGAAAKFKQIVESKTGHKVNSDSEKAALDWLETWLK